MVIKLVNGEEQEPYVGTAPAPALLLSVVTQAEETHYRCALVVCNCYGRLEVLCDDIATIRSLQW